MDPPSREDDVRSNPTEAPPTMPRELNPQIAKLWRIKVREIKPPENAPQ